MSYGSDATKTVLKKTTTYVMVGEHVRSVRSRSMFARGYDEKLTREVFVVDKLLDENDHVTCRVVDVADELIEGRFYAQELQQMVYDSDAELPKGGEELVSKRVLLNRWGTIGSLIAGCPHLPGEVIYFLLCCPFFFFLFLVNLFLILFFLIKDNIYTAYISIFTQSALFRCLIHMDPITIELPSSASARLVTFLRTLMLCLMCVWQVK